MNELAAYIVKEFHNIGISTCGTRWSDDIHVNSSSRVAQAQSSQRNIAQVASKYRANNREREIEDKE